MLESSEEDVVLVEVQEPLNNWDFMTLLKTLSLETQNSKALDIHLSLTKSQNLCSLNYNCNVLLSLFN